MLKRIITLLLLTAKVVCAQELYRQFHRGFHEPAVFRGLVGAWWKAVPVIPQTKRHGVPGVAVDDYAPYSISSEQVDRVTFLSNPVCNFTNCCSTRTSRSLARRKAQESIQAAIVPPVLACGSVAQDPASCHPPLDPDPTLKDIKTRLLLSYDIVRRHASAAQARAASALSRLQELYSLWRPQILLALPPSPQPVTPDKHEAATSPPADSVGSQDECEVAKEAQDRNPTAKDDAEVPVAHITGAQLGGDVQIEDPELQPKHLELEREQLPTALLEPSLGSLAAGLTNAPAAGTILPESAGAAVSTPLSEGISTVVASREELAGVNAALASSVCSPVSVPAGYGMEDRDVGLLTVADMEGRGVDTGLNALAAPDAHVDVFSVTAASTSPDAGLGGGPAPVRVDEAAAGSQPQVPVGSGSASLLPAEARLDEETYSILLPDPIAQLRAANMPADLAENVEGLIAAGAAEAIFTGSWAAQGLPPLQVPYCASSQQDIHGALHYVASITSPSVAAAASAAQGDEFAGSDAIGLTAGPGIPDTSCLECGAQEVEAAGVWQHAGCGENGMDLFLPVEPIGHEGKIDVMCGLDGSMASGVPGGPGSNVPTVGEGAPQDDLCSCRCGDSRHGGEAAGESLPVWVPGSVLGSTLQLALLLATAGLLGGLGWQACEAARTRRTAQSLQEQLDAVLRDHPRALSDLRDQHARLVSALRDEHARQVSELVGDRERRVSGLLDEQAQLLSDLDHRHGRRVSEMQDQHLQLVSELQQRHGERVAELVGEHQQREAELREQHQQREAELQGQHEGLVSKLQTRHQEREAELQQQHEQQVSELQVVHDVREAELMGQVRGLQEELAAAQAEVARQRAVRRTAQRLAVAAVRVSAAAAVQLVARVPELQRNQAKLGAAVEDAVRSGQERAEALAAAFTLCREGMERLACRAAAERVAAAERLACRTKEARKAVEDAEEAHRREQEALRARLEEELAEERKRSAATLAAARAERSTAAAVVRELRQRTERNLRAWLAMRAWLGLRVTQLAELAGNLATEHQRQLQSARNTMERHRAQIELMQMQLEEQVAARVEAIRQSEELESELHQKGAIIVQLEGALSSASHDLESQKRQCDALQSYLTSTDEALTDSRKEVADLAAQLRQARAATRAAEERAEELASANHILDQQMKEMVEATNTLARMQESFLAPIRAQAAALEQQIASERAAAAAAAVERDVKLAEVEKALAEARREVEAVSRARSELADKLELRERELSSLRAEVAERALREEEGMESAVSQREREQEALLRQLLAALPAPLVGLAAGTLPADGKFIQTGAAGSPVSAAAPAAAAAGLLAAGSGLQAMLGLGSGNGIGVGGIGGAAGERGGGVSGGGAISNGPAAGARGVGAFAFGNGMRK